MAEPGEESYWPRLETGCQNKKKRKSKGRGSGREGTHCTDRARRARRARSGSAGSATAGGSGEGQQQKRRNKNKKKDKDVYKRDEPFPIDRGGGNVIKDNGEWPKDRRCRCGRLKIWLLDERGKNLKCKYQRVHESLSTPQCDCVCVMARRKKDYRLYLHHNYGRYKIRDK